MDYIVIYIYLASLLWVGFYQKNIAPKSFLYASRKLTVPAFVATLVSTWYGGILEIGRFSYINGISTWLVFGLFYYIAALIYALYISKHVSISNNDSIPSMFLKHYGKPSALLSILLIFLLASPAPYLKMLASILSYIWKIDVHYALLIGVACSTAYTIRGGFKSVIKTDICLLYTSPSPRDRQKSRMPSSA